MTVDSARPFRTPTDEPFAAQNRDRLARLDEESIIAGRIADAHRLADQLFAVQEAHALFAGIVTPGSPAPLPRKKTFTRAEAEIIVAEWLGKYAAAEPDAVTRDRIATETGISTGLVSKTTAWKAFARERRDSRKPAVRHVDKRGLLAAIPDRRFADPADEVAALEAEQRAELAEQDRRHMRRRERRHGAVT